MKLATYPGPTRDGRLIVVSRDLTRAAPAHDLAPTLLAAVEQWDDVLYLDVERLDLPAGSTPGFLGFSLLDHVVARAQLTVTSETPAAAAAADD